MVQQKVYNKPKIKRKVNVNSVKVVIVFANNSISKPTDAMQ